MQPRLSSPASSPQDGGEPPSKDAARLRQRRGGGIAGGSAAATATSMGSRGTPTTNYTIEPMMMMGGDTNHHSIAHPHAGISTNALAVPRGITKTRFAVDLCVAICVAAISLTLNLLTPYHAAFLEQDPRLSLPYKRSSVPLDLLAVIVVIIPLMAVLAFTVIRSRGMCGLDRSTRCAPDRIEQQQAAALAAHMADADADDTNRPLLAANDQHVVLGLHRGGTVTSATKKTVALHPLPGRCRSSTWNPFLKAGFAGFGLCMVQSLAWTSLFTQGLKTFAGRPRPNFYALCDYKGYRRALETGNMTQYLRDTDPHAFGDVRFCNIEEWKVEAFQSFPSGHASFAFSGLVVLALWIVGASGIYRQGGSGIYQRLSSIGVMMMAATPIFTASLIAISRTRDDWHNYSDVLAGACLGILVASACVAINYEEAGGLAPTPSPYANMATRDFMLPLSKKMSDAGMDDDSLGSRTGLAEEAARKDSPSFVV